MGTGSYGRQAGWLAGWLAVIRNTGIHRFFKNSLWIKMFECLLRLTKIQLNYSSNNAFR